MRCQNRFSLGAVYMTEKVPYEKLFKEADSVLYEVKTRGKNSFEIRKICSYSDDAGTAIRAHESSRAGFAGSRAKADGAIRMKTNRRRSIRNRRRFRCLYRKTGNPQAIRSNPVKQISFTDSGVFE